MISLALEFVLSFCRINFDTNEIFRYLLVVVKYLSVTQSFSPLIHGPSGTVPGLFVRFSKCTGARCIGSECFCIKVASKGDMSQIHTWHFEVAPFIGCF